MKMDSVAALLGHAAPGFVCSNNSDESDKREYVVPVAHLCNEPLGAGELKRMAEMLGANPSVEQMLAFYAKHDGVGLFCNPRTGDPSILILPFDDWAERTEEMLSWIGIDSECMDEEWIPEYPFTVEKLLAVAALNWSPDSWLLAMDGDAAGKVFSFGHEDGSLTEKPYSDDFLGAIGRLFDEAPDCLGGIIRFGAEDVVGDRPSPGTELFPERYVADWRGMVESG